MRLSYCLWSLGLIYGTIRSFIGVLVFLVTVRFYTDDCLIILYCLFLFSWFFDWLYIVVCLCYWGNSIWKFFTDHFSLSLLSSFFFFAYGIPVLCFTRYQHVLWWCSFTQSRLLMYCSVIVFGKTFRLLEIEKVLCLVGW